VVKTHHVFLVEIKFAKTVYISEEML